MLTRRALAIGAAGAAGIAAAQADPRAVRPDVGDRFVVSGGDPARMAGGRFRVGSDKHYPEQGPAHEAVVGALAIERHPVTNARFAPFVAATRYRTVAEGPLDPAAFPGRPAERLLPGSLVFHRTDGPGRSATSDSGGPGCQGPTGATRKVRKA